MRTKLNSSTFGFHWKILDQREQNWLSHFILGAKKYLDIMNLMLIDEIEE
jgi:hypothetical protein